MSKQEFIDKLRIALNGRIAPNLIQEHVNYYEDYINVQVRMGRSEQEVLESLGDPRLIAKTIVETSGRDNTDYVGADYQNSGYQGNDRQSQKMKYSYTGEKTFHMPGWVCAIIAVVALIVIFFLAFSILSVFAPVICVFILVVFFIKLFRDWLN